MSQADRTLWRTAPVDDVDFAAGVGEQDDASFLIRIGAPRIIRQDLALDPIAVARNARDHSSLSIPGPEVVACVDARFRRTDRGQLLDGGLLRVCPPWTGQKNDGSQREAKFALHLR